MIFFLPLLPLLIQLNAIDTSKISLQQITNEDNNWKQLKTIGIVTFSWTQWGKKNSIGTNREIALLRCAKTELEKRGYSVYFINIDNLVEKIKSLPGDWPDISLKNDRPDLVLTTTSKVDTSFNKNSVIVGFELRFYAPRYLAPAWAGAMYIKSQNQLQIIDENYEFIVKRIFDELFNPMKIIPGYQKNN
jgi:hypothetical protein